MAPFGKQQELLNFLSTTNPRRGCWDTIWKLFIVRFLVKSRPVFCSVADRSILRWIIISRFPYHLFEALTFYISPCIYVEAIGMRNRAQLDLKQGTVDLLTLRGRLGPSHGYAIDQRILHEAPQVQQGSLYPALHHLEYTKFLFADWRPSQTGRVAKFPHLTARGRHQLEIETASWARLTEVVGLIL
jgi:PadR family transcriptional regulator, regulatory protein PadR